MSSIEPNDTHAQPPLPLGEVLAAERERQGLSRADAAQRLHMSAWQIEALETGDYARLPQGTFLRGFVRNYSKVLGLDPQAALDALAQAAPNAPAPGIVVPSQNIRFDPLGDRFSSPYVRAWGFAFVTFALALAAIYWWVFVRPAPPATTVARKEAVSQPTPQNLALAPVPAPESAPPREAPRVEDSKPEPAKVEVAKPAERKAEAAKAEAPRQSLLPVTQSAPAARAPGTRTVTLRFKGTSWVEIKERSGKVLLSRLNEPGSQAEVTGQPPFSVVVGNAPDVTLLYDDREFPLEPHTRVAVARFTLE